jgi:hypothetical protein
MRQTWIAAAVVAVVAIFALPVSAQNKTPPVEAVTPSGDKVLLHPNGRWEYLDQRKAEDARKVAEQYPENQGCPPGAQGGLFGIGRCIMPGDKDYNRGSLGRR